MTIAEADGMRLAYIAEVTEGVTPATPAFQILRYTGESIVATKNTVISAEVTPSKNLTDVIHAGDSISGGFEGELSYGTYDALLEGLFRSAWSTNVLINGITRKSFTFEKTAEQGATDSFMRYRGCFINSMSLDISDRSAIKAGFEIMGMGVDDGAAAIITGATYVAANTNEIMPSGTYVGTIAVGGIAALPAIRGVSLNIASNNREQTQVGSNDLAGVAVGRFEVTGTLSCYFTNIELYNAIRDHDSATITIPLGLVTGEKYLLELPAVRFLGGDPIGGGNGQDVAFDVEFQAIYDAATVGTMKITRAVV